MDKVKKGLIMAGFWLVLAWIAEALIEANIESAIMKALAAIVASLIMFFIVASLFK